MLTAMEHASRNHLGDFEDALREGSPSPRQRIVDCYSAAATADETSRNYTTGCFAGNLCQELADTNAAVSETVEYLFRTYTAALAPCPRQV